MLWLNKSGDIDEQNLSMLNIIKHLSSLSSIFLRQSMAGSVFLHWLCLVDSITTLLPSSSMFLLIFPISDFDEFIKLNDDFSGNSLL